MANRCGVCKGISISALVKLARPRFSNLLPAKQNCYPHHKSFDALEETAEQGCDFCQIIVSGFKSTDYPALGPGVTLYTALQLLPKDKTDVKLSIHTTHLRNCPQEFEKVEVFDVLMVQAGPLMDDKSVLDFDELHEWRLELLLTLTTPRGKAPFPSGCHDKMP